MEIFKPQHPSPDDQEFLMGATRIFWDLDKTKLDFERHYRGIITRVLNYGSFEDVQRISQIYQQGAIKEVLANPIRGDWFPRTYKAFCNIFNVQPDNKAFNILYVGQKIRHGMNNIFNGL